MEEIDKEILIEFIKETQEELGALDSQFITLEKHPQDSDVINAIFRTIHSIKGSSSFFNLNHIRSFAHKLENLLDELRKGQRAITGEIIDLLLKGKDSLDSMFQRLAEEDLGTELNEDEEKCLEVIESTLASKKEAAITPKEIFEQIVGIKKGLDKDELLEHPMVSDLLRAVEELQDIILEPSERPLSDIPKMGEILVEQGLVGSEDVEGALNEQKKLGEILVEQGKVDENDIEGILDYQRSQGKDLPEKKATDVKKPSEKRSALKKTMRIEEDKIDEFMNLVGELIINSEVFNYLQKKLEGGEEIGKLIMELKNANLEFSELTLKLQGGLAEVRKVAINGIFQKLPRMVRDLSGQIGKKADFYMSGEDLLIDKSLLEELESPIVHIIRNSVDHGIEPPEVREKAGKDPTGKVEAIAEESMGDLVIYFKDDGHGMDAGKLKAKALEKGIITQAEADVMKDKEACKLIFAPGFSTAEKVTDVSGRGVGMDVVMTAIKKVKGKVDIDTELGKGTTLSLTVPMSSTLITISGLVVAVGTEQYIIPMEWVVESLKPTKEQVSSITKKGEVVDIRTHLYPLLRLYKMFHIEPKYTNPWDAVVMVIEKDGQRACLMVDEIIDETRAVLKDLGGTFRSVDGVLGGAILGDGKIGLVLDAEGLIRSHASIMGVKKEGYARKSA